MSLKEKQRTIRNIARLRQAERTAKSPEIAAVRSDLEEALGGTVSRNLAASLLGVSHTALNNWIAMGDVPVVISERGRKVVPVGALLDLYELIGEEGDGARRHRLEPVMRENRRRAKLMRPAMGPEFSETAGHRRAELRSLAYHRRIAPRLRRRSLDEAAQKIRLWQRQGRINSHYADLWLELLAKPVHEVRKVISTDNQFGRDLRQSSPFAGELSEPERRKILETVR
jgi:hypothetical protein